MIKAIFFDIDGTLISIGSKRMPQDTIDALKKLRERGIKIFLASGRGVRQLEVITKDVKFDGYITLNGQICLDEQLQLYFGNEIPKEDWEVLKELFESKALPAIIVEENRSYMNYQDDFTERVQKEIGVKGTPLGTYEGAPVYQMILYADVSYAEKLFEKLPHCKWSRWHPNGIDIFSKNGGKMTGIEKTLEYFGIKREETMAFGDGDNDVEMLKYVEIGIAMGNAEEGTKAVADYVTSAQHQQGISRALEHFGLI